MSNEISNQEPMETAKTPQRSLDLVKQILASSSTMIGLCTTMIALIKVMEGTWAQAMSISISRCSAHCFSEVPSCHTSQFESLAVIRSAIILSAMLICYFWWAFSRWSA